jgi:DNA-binding GntR family transcriptional regulator
LFLFSDSFVFAPVIRPDADVLLEISGLHARVEDKAILKGVNLTLRAGEIHAVMGRNGSGKSSLLRVIAGQAVLDGGDVRTGEGVIELMPNRGAVVATLSRDDLEHAFELMAALEGLAGELAATRATTADVRRIRSLQAEMTAAHSRRDLPAYYRINRAIHSLIVGLAGNPMLTDSHARLNARLQAVRFRSNLNREKWDAALAEHGAMVKALAARDGPRLAALLRTHLAGKRATVLAQLDDAGGERVRSPRRASVQEHRP